MTVSACRSSMCFRNSYDSFRLSIKHGVSFLFWTFLGLGSTLWHGRRRSSFCEVHSMTFSILWCSLDDVLHFVVFTRSGMDCLCCFGRFCSWQHIVACFLGRYCDRLSISTLWHVFLGRYCGIVRRAYWKNTVVLSLAHSTPQIFEFLQGAMW